MQRQHKEEFLNKMSQSLHVESTEVSRPEDINPMAQSYHFKTETSGKSNEAEMTLPSNVVPSKIMYESGISPKNIYFICAVTRYCICYEIHSESFHIKFFCLKYFMFMVPVLFLFHS